MFNSGVIGVRIDHKVVFEDSIFLIDKLIDLNLPSHAIEQFAISEMLRFHSVKIIPTNQEIKHYWRSTDKKYIRFQLANLFSEGFSALNESYPKVDTSWLAARAHKILKIF
jgi:hypothetical protein